MKTLHRVTLAAVPLAAAGLLPTPGGPAAGSAGWMVNPAAPAAHAICAVARLPYRTPAAADAREVLDGLAKFTSSRFDTAWARIGGPIAAAGSGRAVTAARAFTWPAASGFPSAGGPAVAARSRSCL